jgi:hypothetical protein
VAQAGLNESFSRFLVHATRQLLGEKRLYLITFQPQQPVGAEVEWHRCFQAGNGNRLSLLFKFISQERNKSEAAIDRQS